MTESAITFPLLESKAHTVVLYRKGSIHFQNISILGKATNMDTPRCQRLKPIFRAHLSLSRSLRHHS